MFQNYITELSEKKQLTANVFLFHFQLIDLKTIDFKAGQYLMLKINGQCRLYSICSPDYIKDSFELVVEMVPGGLGSTYFDNLKVGDRVDFQGPAGCFTLKATSRDKIFLATGTGIAPIKSMIYEVQSSKFKVQSYLFWGLKTRQDVYFLEELKQLSNETMEQFKFYICLSREKDLAGLDPHYFMSGHINDGLQQLMSNFPALPAGRQFPISNFEYYICGSREVVSSMVEFLQKQKIAKENIFFEKF
jgi:Na+-transporting NADH:ubiquinone oxidoreductase subunit F